MLNYQKVANFNFVGISGKITGPPDFLAADHLVRVWNGQTHDEVLRGRSGGAKKGVLRQGWWTCKIYIKIWEKKRLWRWFKLRNMMAKNHGSNMIFQIIFEQFIYWWWEYHGNILIRKQKFLVGWFNMVQRCMIMAVMIPAILVPKVP